MAGDEPASAAALTAAFPGINFVRYADYDLLTADKLPLVADLAAHNIVVEIERHTGAGGGVPADTGGALSAVNAWFQSLATAFKNNPYVWFGTLNEPNQDSALVAEQQANYNAIRGTGNNTIIMFSTNDIVPSINTSSMSNVVVDWHYYGWVSGYSADQATVTAALMSGINASQQLTTTSGKMPVIVGEYGNSTNGQSIDANASQVLNAVQKSGYGSAAWAWGSGNPGDGLTTGGNGLSSYGQEVAAYIGLVAGAQASIWACSGAELAAVTQANTTALTTLAQTPNPTAATTQANITAAPPTSGDTTATQTPVTDPAAEATAPTPTDAAVAAVASDNAAADAAIAAANKIIAGISQ
jgi:hypothetical protein